MPLFDSVYIWFLIYVGMEEIGGFQTKIFTFAWAVL
jgi:hypothetical protein